MMNKTNLRIEAKKIRKNLCMAAISMRLADLIRRNKNYQLAKNVMLFYPTKFEVDLKKLFLDEKNFYLPRVKMQELEVCPFKSYSENIHDFTPLKKSALGIYEPQTKAINPKILDIVIVPALMADEKGYRLGYGGGFYDRLINKYGSSFTTICPIPKELLIESLPIDKFDKKIDDIIYC